MAQEFLQILQEQRTLSLAVKQKQAQIGTARNFRNALKFYKDIMGFVVQCD